MIEYIIVGIFCYLAGFFTLPILGYWQHGD